jgi:hypothetical protein
MSYYMGDFVYQPEQWKAWHARVGIEILALGGALAVNFLGASGTTPSHDADTSSAVQTQATEVSPSAAAPNPQHNTENWRPRLPAAGDITEAVRDYLVPGTVESILATEGTMIVLFMRKRKGQTDLLARQKRQEQNKARSEAARRISDAGAQPINDEEWGVLTALERSFDNDDLV